MKGTERWIVIVVASMFVFLIIFGILLWKLGLFEFTGANASTKIIAATLALIGGLFGSLVTVLGIFLKHSLDQRAERRLEIDSDRNDVLRKEAEQRLKLEAAIQAVQLLSTSSGKDVPETQRAGVLFTLADLGQEDLAINLAIQMTDAGNIDAVTLDSLIDRALKSNDEGTVRDALFLLSNVASTMFLEKKDRWHWPTCLNEWNPQLTPMVRRRGLSCYLEQMLSRQYSEMSKGYLERVIICLASYWRNEEYEHLKNGAGLCLEKILNVHKIPEDQDLVTSDDTPIEIHDIKVEVTGLNEKKNILNVFTGFITLSERIDKWSTSGPAMPDQPVD